MPGRYVDQFSCTMDGLYIGSVANHRPQLILMFDSSD